MNKRKAVNKPYRPRSEKVMLPFMDPVELYKNWEGVNQSLFNVDKRLRMPFECGWTRELIIREKGSRLVQYITPDGRKLSTLNELKFYCRTGLVLENFSLLREPLYIGPPNEIVIREFKEPVIQPRKSQQLNFPVPLPSNKRKYSQVVQQSNAYSPPQRSPPKRKYSPAVEPLNVLIEYDESVEPEENIEVGYEEFEHSEVSVVNSHELDQPQQFNDFIHPLCSCNKRRFPAVQQSQSVRLSEGQKRQSNKQN